MAKRNKELDSFLKASLADGEEVDQGVFTLAPDSAREKLKGSVPPELRNPLVPLTYLRFCLRRQGLEPVRSPYSTEGINVAFATSLALALDFVDIKGTWDPVEFVHQLDTCQKSPFTEQDLVSIFLSRALLILSVLELDIIFRFPGMGCPPVQIVNSGKVCKVRHHRLQTDLRRLGKRRVEVVLGPSHGFTGTPSETDRELARHAPDQILYRLKRVASSEQKSGWLGKVVGLGRWGTAPSRILLHFMTANNDGYAYKTKRPSLLEYIVTSGQPTPLPLNPALASSDSDLLQRPGEHLSSWIRYTTREEFLIVRQFDAGLRAVQGRYFARAVFVVCLSERPCEIRFCTEVEGVRGVKLPEFPPGVLGIVFWPSLKQTMYGEAWIEDENYAQALQWTLRQLEQVMETVRAEFDYIWRMLERDHVKKPYWKEIENRLRKLYFRSEE